MVMIRRTSDVPLKYSTRLPFKMPVRTFGPFLPRRKSTRFLISGGACHRQYLSILPLRPEPCVCLFHTATFRDAESSAGKDGDIPVIWSISSASCVKRKRGAHCACATGVASDGPAMLL